MVNPPSASVMAFRFRFVSLCTELALSPAPATVKAPVTVPVMVPRTDLSSRRGREQDGGQGNNRMDLQR